MPSHAEIEMRWIDAWNDVHAIADNITADRRNLPCLLPDGSIVGFNACLGWLQDSAYQGFSALRVESGWAGYCRGIIASRAGAGAGTGAETSAL